MTTGIWLRMPEPRPSSRWNPNPSGLWASAPELTPCPLLCVAPWAQRETEGLQGKWHWFYFRLCLLLPSVDWCLDLPQHMGSLQVGLHSDADCLWVWVKSSPRVRKQKGGVSFFFRGHYEGSLRLLLSFLPSFWLSSIMDLSPSFHLLFPGPTSKCMSSRGLGPWNSPLPRQHCF